MSKQCIGCGIVMQNEDENALGYAVSLEKDYCQRCFRLIHYNDVVISMQQGIDNDKLLQEVNEKDALIVWVVDILDFESSVIKGMNRHLLNKDIVLICTKTDLLPRDININKVSNFIMRRLKENGIKIKAIAMCPNLHRQDEDSIQVVEDIIAQFREERDVVMLGSANAGKSTLLNGLLHSKDLTTSMHPGTTLDLNPIAYEDYILYDTPGLSSEHSLLTYVKEEQLKDVILNKQMNPKKFQLRDNQSIAIGGYARLDLEGCEDVSVVCYFSERLPIHRGKLEQADKLWNEHLGELLSPTIDQDLKEMKKYHTNKKLGKMDVVIAGLGWFCVQGNIQNIHVFVNENVDVIFREAMI